MRKNIIIVCECIGIGTFIILSIGLIVVLLIRPQFNIDLGSLFDPSPKTATVNSARTILVGYRELSQLVTYEMSVAKAGIEVGVEQPGALGTNLCGYNALYVGEGIFRAGIDFSSLNEKISYNEMNHTLTLTLPSASLTSCDITYFDQYSGSVTFCPGINYQETENLAEYITLLVFRDDVIRKGILDKAQEEAETILKTLLQSTLPVIDNIQTSIVVEFDPNSTPEDDFTCQPEPPQGWKKNDNGSWSKP